MATFDILTGDVGAMLGSMAPTSVQTIVTSPPYWGLRDYGMSGQIGLEETPEAYVSRLVVVFQQAKRVLKDDGTLWLNLGDSYCATPRGNRPGDFSTSSLTNPKRQDEVNRVKDRASKQASNLASNFKGPNRSRRFDGLKGKDLVGIPWMVAFALRADGWYLRSDIIWAKPNPMPESVTDRPTRAHEYLFLLTKSKRYYYDADAIREPYAESTMKQIADGYNGVATKDYSESKAQDPSETKRRVIAGARRKADALGLNGRNVQAVGGEETRRDGISSFSNNPANRPRGLGRNRRSVWTITPQPFRGAHFATFPEKLVEPCVLAGSRPGDTVLDPFCGSGRAGVVALKHGRVFIGIELNPDYVMLATDALMNVQNG